ncbi:hypothetical protein Lferr_1936 [Acidithiobacillus ferrooxidans ATCC 53993]|nr:hypothetical protein Lferr_1936 [Acidithiobacillus ferrooxidans ATCC 53993]
MISYLHLLKVRCQSWCSYGNVMLVAMISQTNAARYYRDKADLLAASGLNQRISTCNSCFACTIMGYPA